MTIGSRPANVAGTLDQPTDIKKIFVLIIEDNRLVRDGLTALLEAQPDFKVAGTAEGVSTGLGQAQLLNPQIVLIDAGPRRASSSKLVEDVRKAAPEARVIVMDLLPAQEDIIDYIRAGASGFIVKDATVNDFVATIRSVAKGGTVVPSALTGTLLSHIADHAVRRQPDTRDAARMTKREREVIDLITEGMSNKEIAKHLHVATHTVKSHVHNILEKLALHSRLQIAAHTHQNNRKPSQAI